MAQQARSVDFPAVTYQPRSFPPGSEHDPSLLVQIREDLRILYDAGFRSLVTYGANGYLAEIPKLARDIGFDGPIILGVWDPLSEQEVENAVAQAAFVDGYGIGNEGLDSRYSPEQLATVMSGIRTATGRPVSTTEPIDSYLGGPHREWLLANSDWLFPLAHPFWADHTEPSEAVRWIVARYDLLQAETQRPVVLKEAGFPSAGLEPYDEERQRDFHMALHAQDLVAFLFEAFDQPWKPENDDPRSMAEQHWGLFRVDGTPKAAAHWLTAQWRHNQ